MKMSTLTIYSNSNLTYDRNLIVDNIEEYLLTIDSFHVFDFQYIKNKLNLEIKVNLNQEYIDKGYSIGKTQNYDYLSIENMNDNKYYYFIVSKDWISENTIKFVLKLDVLNTYRLNVDYSLSNRTRIFRQHKDRFKNYFTTNSSGKKVYKRNIDLYSEQINPQLYRKSFDHLNIPSINMDWYLIYKTRDTLSSEDIANPLECYLCASQELLLSSQGDASQTLTYDDISESFYYVFLENENPNGQFIVHHSNNRSTTYTFGSSSSVGILKAVKFHKNTSNGNIDIEINYYNENGLNNQLANIVGYSIEFLRPFNNGWTSSNDVNMSSYYQVIYNEDNFTKLELTTKGEKIVSSINSIDKTDSRLVKIILLPYCPMSITKNGIYYSIPNGFEYYNGLFRLKNLNLKFKNELSFTCPAIDPLSCLVEYDSNKLRTMDYESKLFHSDFYYLKFIYDDSAFIYQYEKMNNNVTLYNDVHINFYVTNTVNSRFNFEFVDYNLTYPTDDYSKWLTISRNNEITIYSNSYVNYIRNGYNYDVKAKSRSETLTWINALSGITSSLLPGKANTISRGLSIVGNLSNAIAQTISQEENLLKKQAELKAQATNVYGSDDVDLLIQYNKNRLIASRYELSDKAKQSIYDLFYYCGYVANVTGIPDFSSRTRFNYVQADIVFSQIGNIQIDCINELKSKFMQGVTNIHNLNNSWDILQVYENYEVFIKENEQ